MVPCISIYERKSFWPVTLPFRCNSFVSQVSQKWTLYLNRNYIYKCHWIKIFLFCDSFYSKTLPLQYLHLHALVKNIINLKKNIDLLVKLIGKMWYGLEIQFLFLYCCVLGKITSSLQKYHIKGKVYPIP